MRDALKYYLKPTLKPLYRQLNRWFLFVTSIILFNPITIQADSEFTLYERLQNTGERTYQQQPYDTRHLLTPRWGSSESPFFESLFFKDAQEVIDQVRLLFQDRDLPKNLNDWVYEIEQKLYSLKNNPLHLSILKQKITDWNQWAQQLQQQENRVLKIEQLTQKLFQSLPPSYQQLRQDSLIVPLSVRYFNSHPLLKKHFDQVWINSRYDIRILGGSSGEGIQTQDLSFLQMNKLFESTQTLIRHTSSELLRFPESQWLQNLPTSTLATAYRRFIFIHELTWDLPVNAPFADYIPIDPQIMGVQPLPLMTVLIHELNVNSPDFLYIDTHLPHYQIESERRLNAPSLNPVTDSKTREYIKMGRQPLLALVYLSLLLSTHE